MIAVTGTARKKLVEAAFRHCIHPRDLTKELRALHGVNNALAQWDLPRRHTIAPQELVSMTGDQLTDTPNDLDGSTTARQR